MNEYAFNILPKAWAKEEAVGEIPSGVAFAPGFTSSV
jgi:hypothetical protein